MPSPKWGDVREFCKRQGYQERKTDHYKYEKVLPDMSVSDTIVSFGADGETVSAGMWRRVWKRQLRLASEDDFWSGLAGGPVRYDIPPTPEEEKPLPEYLRHFLEYVCHFSEEQIQQTSREEAQRLLNEHYARPIRKAKPPE